MAKIKLTQAQKEVLEALMKCKNFEPNPKLGIRKSRGKMNNDAHNE